jgi:hypothetical protein
MPELTVEVQCDGDVCCRSGGGVVAWCIHFDMHGSCTLFKVLADGKPQPRPLYESTDHYPVRCRECLEAERIALGKRIPEEPPQTDFWNNLLDGLGSGLGTKLPVEKNCYTKILEDDKF